MIETPPSFADTPDPPARPDLLSEMLRAVRLTGSVFFGGSFTAPFRVESPKRFEQRTPLAHLHHISIFHLVAHGRCTFETASGNRRDIGPGDLLLMPFADAHKFWAGNTTETAYVPDLVRPGPIEGMLTLNYGGGGEETRLVCGYLESSEFLFAPVFRTLPEVLVEQTGGGGIGQVIASTVREIIALVDAATPGSQLILGRLMELLFVEVLRRHITRLPADSKGWLAALNDPIVGRALQLIHAEPGQRWTAERLAREGRTAIAQACSDRLCDELAHPARRRTAARDRSGHRQDRFRRGLRIGGGVQPRIQTRDRNHARALARRRQPRSTGRQGAADRWRRAQPRIAHSLSESSVALPPAAAVLIVTVCSVAKRRR